MVLICGNWASSIPSTILVATSSLVIIAVIAMIVVVVMMVHMMPMVLLAVTKVLVPLISLVLILFAISDNLSAENSKLSADSWNRGNHLLGCMIFWRWG